VPVIRKIAKIGIISVIGYFAVAVGLIVSEAPDSDQPAARKSLDFQSIASVDYSDLQTPKTFVARDGSSLAYRLYMGSQSKQPKARFVILVHGSGWHGMQFHAMAKHLAATGAVNVIVPDMRGHGANPARRGDVDHIGQLEEDMADLITHLYDTHGVSKIVLGGHSSGGGFVVRFAGGAYGDRADAFILLAPFLKYNAPTTKTNSGGWARPATRRIIGLTMLNAVGLTILNDLPVISFAMPEAVLKGPYGDTATTVYTYRMNTAFAPRADYEKDLKAITVPLLVMAGDADEAFHATRYEDVIARQTATGTYKILPGMSHMDVVMAPEAFNILNAWLETLTP
jgi:non-heme chloroperoxidase